MDRTKEFSDICSELCKIFERKNREYGDDYFSDEYTDLERWLSIKRKIVRLTNHFNSSSNNKMNDETIIDTWKDLAIYSIMELMRKGETNEK